MRNIIIKSYQIKREILIWVLMFLIATAMNIYSVFKYDTSWQELYQYFHVTLILSFVFYFLLGFVRIVVRFFKILFTK